MELRPLQAALVAGRAASRWATTTSTAASKPSLHIPLHMSTLIRPFSSTTRVCQEAEAAAPAPPVLNGSMSQLMSQHRQRQDQQQQPAPSQDPASSQQGVPNTQSNDIFGSSSALVSPWQSRGKTPKAFIQQQSASKDAMRDLGLNKWLDPSADDIKFQRDMGIVEDQEERKLRLRPVIGRTIDFENVRDQRNKDLARGLTRLNMECRINRINQDSKRQRFHERPGLKRKRLKSERWQARFREGFQATCARVSELAKQGW